MCSAPCRRATDAAVFAVQKYDFVINKLVAAVDAEFTLLNNRLKQLETALAVAPGGDGQAAAGDAPPAAAAEATAIDAGAR